MLKEITLKKARMEDIPHLFSLINAYAEEQILLPRPLGTLYETLRDFVVAWDKGKIIGVGALHVVWKDLGEIRSLAVIRPYWGKGIGRLIVEFLLQEAQEMAISQVFALTYKPEFFEKCGFKRVPKDIFPHKVWNDCINCIKFPHCDEIAVMINLRDTIVDTCVSEEKANI